MDTKLLIALALGGGALYYVMSREKEDEFTPSPASAPAPAKTPFPSMAYTGSKTVTTTTTTSPGFKATTTVKLPTGLENDPAFLRQVVKASVGSLNMLAKKGLMPPAAEVTKTIGIYTEKLGESFSSWYYRQPEANTTWSPLTTWLQANGLLAKNNPVRWGWIT